MFLCFLFLWAKSKYILRAHLSQAVMDAWLVLVYPGGSYLKVTLSSLTVQCSEYFSAFIFPGNAQNWTLHLKKKKMHSVRIPLVNMLFLIKFQKLIWMEVQEGKTVTVALLSPAGITSAGSPCLQRDLPTGEELKRLGKCLVQDSRHFNCLLNLKWVHWD